MSELKFIECIVDAGDGSNESRKAFIARCPDCGSTSFMVWQIEGHGHFHLECHTCHVSFCPAGTECGVRPDPKIHLEVGLGDLYHGIRLDRCIITVRRGDNRSELELGPSLRVYGHSPTGWEWSYSGSGPAQTALGILLDFTGDKDFALAYHQQFKSDVIAGLPSAEWTLPFTDIERWCKEAKKAKA